MSKYRIIKSKQQYTKYCISLKGFWKNPTDDNEEDRETLEIFIEKWEKDTLKNENTDPIELLKFLMANHNMERNDLVRMLGIGKGLISKILNYKKGLSKNVIRKLSEHFKVSQEAFNRTYPIISEASKGHKDEKGMNTTKNITFTPFPFTPCPLTPSSFPPSQYNPPSVT